MKTLDEVINGFEHCIHDDCMECSYQWEPKDLDCIGQVREDALHYLKEYRKTQTAYIKAMADLEDNPPLTWDELRQMEGKPVWVEGSWEIIARCTEDFFLTDCDAMFYRKNDECYGDFGIDWEAYRKERE